MIPDFGNSLGAVISATQALLNGAESDPRLRRDLLGEMEVSLRHLHHLYENWILWKAQRKGAMRLQKRHIRPHEWLDGLLASWRGFRPDKGLAWSEHFSPTLPGIQVDVNLMERALGNLLYSAIHCAPQRSEIHFSCAVAGEGTRLRIELCDEGPPVSWQDIPALEDSPGQPGKHPRLAGGLGLGLAVANRIVRSHGGVFHAAGSADSNCFQLEIPLE